MLLNARSARRPVIYDAPPGECCQTAKMSMRRTNWTKVSDVQFRHSRKFCRISLACVLISEIAPFAGPDSLTRLAMNQERHTMTTTLNTMLMPLSMVDSTSRQITVDLAMFKSSHIHEFRTHAFVCDTIAYRQMHVVSSIACARYVTCSLLPVNIGKALVMNECRGTAKCRHGCHVHF